MSEAKTAVVKPVPGVRVPVSIDRENQVPLAVVAIKNKRAVYEKIERGVCMVQFDGVGTIVQTAPDCARYKAVER